MNIKNLSTTPLLALLGAALFAVSSSAQGPLTPPGAPAPTMKTLDQIEPRTPISQADMPYSISVPGSYYLSTNLTGVAGSAGITIETDDVTLDLNGFTLRGVPGSFEGIDVSLFPARNITIRNGVVREWGFHGVDAAFANNSSLENLKAYTNGWGSTFQDGLRIGENGWVRGCQAEGNQHAGIAADINSTITDSIASNNGDVGIGTSDGCTITDATAYYNGDDGIVTGDDCTVSRCTTSFNTGDGIQISSASTVIGNTCGNAGDNNGAGIHATGSENRIEGNTVRDNDRGLEIDGIDNYVSDNIVIGNGDNYNLAAGNQLNILLSEVPESIDWPASVKLAGTLTGESGSAGIIINSGDVTIDLDGHALVGVPGSLQGIVVPFPIRRNITIRNGVVREWGLHGVDAFNAFTSSLEDLKAYTNGWGGALQDGLRIGPNGRVRSCQAENNGADGIETSFSCTITDATAYQNGRDGIVIGTGCTITDSTASNNGDDGIQTSDGCTVSRCTTSFNTENGIHTRDNIETISGCTITDSTASNNGDSGIVTGEASTVSRCTTRLNAADGIQISSDSTVLLGNASDNNGAGIHVTGRGNRIEGNTLTDNERGLEIDETDNYVSDNIVIGNGDNYNLAAGNHLNLLLSEVPESIDWPASVKLAGTLTGESGSQGITITSSDVTIDLDGHALVGVPGSDNGIIVPISPTHNITIRNGVVREWGRHGVDAASAHNSSLENLKAYTNGWEATFKHGLSIGPNGRVRGCQAENNQHNGIMADIACTITDSTASYNGGEGIQTDDGCTITDSTASYNGGEGIQTLNACTITDSTAYENARDGIQVQGDCAVLGNTCANNGIDSVNAAGIKATDRGNRIDGNTVTDNLAGIHVLDPGNIIIRNTASDNGTNYVIAADNRYGPIVDISAPGTPAVSGSSAGDTMATSHPWANFSH